MNLEMIEERTGRKFERVETMKTNGVVRLGVRALDSNSNVVPVMYQDEFTDEQFTNLIADHYSDYEVPQQAVEFLNKDYVLQHVFPALVNSELNTENLLQWVNRGFNDLSIIYKVSVDNGVFTITNGILHYIDATIDEIHEAAMRNLEPNIMDMEDMLIRMGHPTTPGMRGIMYVLSNKAYCYGAGSLLNDKILHDLYSGIGSFYIIPSSVHEVICVPKFNDDVSELKKMVMEVNATVVEPTEKLSDNVYEYNGEVVSMIEVA